MNFNNKHVKRVTAVVILLIIAAMVLTSVIPYLI